LLGLKDKYFSELSTNDFIKSVDNITTYPVSNLTSGIKLVINSIDLSVSGSFYIDLLDYDSLDISRSVGKKVKIGFNTIELTTVESTNNVGQDSSIALDSNGYAYISYRDTTNYDLRYCNNTLGAWTCTVLDTPANQQGYETSIAIDSNDKVHISHRDYTTNDLRYCTNAQGTWSCTGVDTTGNVGSQSSIAIDKNDKVHISHRNFTGSYSSLRYCNNTLGTWTCTNVEVGASGIGSLGWYDSIAIDSNNKVHISHQNFTGYVLRYCNNTLGTWTCTNVEKGGSIGLDTSIAIDSNNKVHISHRNTTSGALRYCNNIPGTWTCTNVDTAGALKYTSIAIDNNDKVHISHGDDTNYDLRYCNNTLGTWTCGVVDNLVGSSTDDVYTNGRAIAMKKGRIVDSTSFSPNISISYYDAGGGNLKYARLVNYLTLGPQVDTTPPIVTIESPTNTTYNVMNVWANVTLNETGSWCGRSLDSENNITMSKDNSTHFYDLMTVSAASHNVRFCCNDTSNNMNCSAIEYFSVEDITPPQWSGNATYPSSPISYQPGQFYRFNVTWQDPNSAVSVVLIEQNFTTLNSNLENKTMFNQSSEYYFNVLDLPAGTYVWRSYANNTDNYFNFTSQWTYIINKASTLTKLYLNDSESDKSYNKSEIVNITATTNISSLIVSLYANYTGKLEYVNSNIGMTYNFTNTSNLALGPYLVLSNTTGNDNYTNSQVNYTLTVVDKMPPQYFDNSTNNTIGGYMTEFRLRWTDNNNLSSYIFYLDNCTNQLKKMNESRFPIGGNVDWSKAYYVINTTTGCTIKWMFGANDTSNNQVNSSIYSFQVAFAYLPVMLREPSPTVCNDTNPCDKGQYKTYNVSANATCRLLPPDYGNCGQIYGLLRYNNTSSVPDTPIPTAPGVPLYVKPLYTVIYFNDTLFSNNFSNTAFKGSDSSSSPDAVTDPFTDTEYNYVNKTDGYVNVSASAPQVCGGAVQLDYCEQFITLYDCNTLHGACCFWCKYCIEPPYCMSGPCPSPSQCTSCPGCSLSYGTAYAHTRFTFNLSTYGVNKIINITYYYKGYYDTSGSATFDAYLQSKNSTGWFRDQNIATTNNMYSKTFSTGTYDLSNYVLNDIFSFAVTGMATSGSASITTHTDFVKLVVYYRKDNPQPCGSGSLQLGKTCTVEWIINTTGNILTGWKIDVNFSSEQYKNPPNNAYNDTDNAVIRIIEKNPPQWSNNKTSPLSGVNYSSGASYQFNITWTDETSVDKVIFEWGGTTNYTSSTTPAVYNLSNEYYINLTDLVAGTYTYKWYANDTFKNWNFSSHTYKVNPAPSQTWLYLNWTQGDRSYNKSEIAYIYANCTGCSSGDSISLVTNYTGTPSTINHIHNTTLKNDAYNYTNTANLALGSYWINASTSDQNHSESKKSYILRVVDTTPPRYSNNSTNSTTAGKPILFSVKWTDDEGLSYANFSLDNCTGTFKNIVNMSLSGKSAWSNFTATINSTANCTIRWEVNASDTSNNWNVSENSFNTTTPLKIWNLVIRDVPGELPIVKTITGVAVIISVNVSGDINYVEGNFTWPNGTMVYKNLTEISNKIYTHNWTYTILYVMPVGIARINVTAYDKYGFTNSTNTTLNISETAVLSLLNDPINFSTVSTGKVVNATEMRGWPLLAVVQGNMPMNLSQAAEGDLVGQTKSNIKIGVKNVTWNTTDYGIFSNLTTQFMRIVDNIMPNNNQSIYYKLNVPTVEPQYYSGNVSIKGEY
jgi:hypothetical protein